MTLRVNYFDKAAALHAAHKTVERVAEARLPTEASEFRIIGFRSLVSPKEFVALVKGHLRPDRPSPVRVHSQCMTGEVFGSLRCDCAGQLDAALRHIEREGVCVSKRLLSYISALDNRGEKDISCSIQWRPATPFKTCLVRFWIGSRPRAVLQGLRSGSG